MYEKKTRCLGPESSFRYEVEILAWKSCDFAKKETGGVEGGGKLKRLSGIECADLSGS